MADKVQRMHAAVSAALEGISTMFKPGIKVTFIARAPGNPEGDVLIGDDQDPLELIALVKRRFADVLPAPAAPAQAAPSERVANMADLLAALRAVKEWDIDGWKERGFALPTELRARIQSLVTPGRKCWNCAEISEPCYDGGTPWCVKCGVVDNPTRPAAIEHDHSEGGHHD